jgi:hypothetical protein
VARERRAALRVELDVADPRVVPNELDHVGEPRAAAHELDVLREHQQALAFRTLDDLVHRLDLRAVAEDLLADEVEALDVVP